MGGMFREHNYGADFVNSMAASAGMFNDQRRLGMDQRRLDMETETRGLQNTRLKQENEAGALDIEHKKYVQDQEKTFSDLFAIEKRRQLDPTYQYTDDDIKLAGKALGWTPGIPNNPDEFPQAQKNMGVLLNASQEIRKIPPGWHILSRGENPAWDSVFDAQQALISDNHLGQPHVDADGSVTGKPGTSYKTTGIGGSGVLSGEGNKAAFLPLYSVAFEDGTPILNKNGKPVLVPKTDDRSNGPNAKLSPLTPDDLQMMVGARGGLITAVNNMIAANPENKTKIMQAAMEASMSLEEKKKVFQDRRKGKAAAESLRKRLPEMAGLQKEQMESAIDYLESGQATNIKEAAELAKIGKPDKAVITVGEGGMLVSGSDIDPATGGLKVLAANPKDKSPVNLFGEAVKGADLARQYPEAKGLDPKKYYRVARDGSRTVFAEERPPKSAGEGGDGTGSGNAKLGKLKTITDAVDDVLVRRFAPFTKANPDDMAGDKLSADAKLSMVAKNYHSPDDISAIRNDMITVMQSGKVANPEAAYEVAYQAVKARIQAGHDAKVQGQREAFKQTGVEGGRAAQARQPAKAPAQPVRSGGMAPVTTKGGGQIYTTPKPGGGKYLTIEEEKARMKKEGDEQTRQSTIKNYFRTGPKEWVTLSNGDRAMKELTIMDASGNITLNPNAKPSKTVWDRL